jgi:predicted RND superfamily exporter protein
MLLLPAVLKLLRTPRRVIDPEAPGAIGGFLRWVARLVIRRPRTILAISAALLVAAVFGTTRIVPNTAIIDYFAAGSPMRVDYAKVEAAFGASSQIQVLVEGDLGDPVTLQSMLDFQEAVSRVDGVGPATSIATMLRAIHWTLTGEEGLPTTREGVAQELLIYQLSGDPSQISAYMTLDSSMGLVDIATTSPSTREMRRIQNEVEAAAAATLGQHANLSYTGTSLIQLAVEDSLLHDFLISLSLAILLVIIIDSFVRSVRAAVVTILALLLTIALQYGMLGVLNIPLDLSTMLLGALAIGVGDYAIHLTVRYMEERRLGNAPEAAMTNAILSSGRSILFTALTLGAGFAAMIVSQFVPVSTLGSLMTFTVLSVGTASLTLLPAACLLFLRNPRGSTNPNPALEATHV